MTAPSHATLPAAFGAALDAGLAALGLEVTAPARAKLAAYVEHLLRWNARVNLTAVTDPAQIAELHLVDSLALLRTLGPARTLLDVGCGAGLPGVPVACVRPEVAVTGCDAVQKKVAFVKAVAAALDLPVRARAVRAGGDPEGEGLPRCEAVVSRALADPARWLPLGARYLAPGGRLFAMLGPRDADPAALEAIAGGCGLALEGVDRFSLPLGGAERAVARFAAR